MRPVSVVLLPPRVQPGLQVLEVLERAVVVEQLVLQGLVQPLDFPVVVGDAGRVSRWVMPFSRQIRSNSTSAGRGLMNRPVNTVPFVREHFLGRAVDAHGVQEGLADRPGSGPQYRFGDDAVPGVVIDPVTIFISLPSARNALAVTSSCHSCIATGRFHRL